MPSPFTGPMFPTDPITMLMLTGGTTQDPQLQDAAAHWLAQVYQPPPIPGKPQAAAGAGAGTGGTTITPPTRTIDTMQAGATTTQTGLPTGAPDQPPPSTVGNTGSDGQSIQPGPQAPSTRPLIQVPDPYAGASQKDRGTWAGTEGGNTSQVGGQDDPGRMSAGLDDATGTSNVGDKTGKIGSALTDFGKSLGALAPPAKEDLRTPLPPLPGHESRFTPQDLLALVQGLSQAGSKTQPQSLGSLIGVR